MTGFGQAEIDLAGRMLTAEVRSVNHRYLELSLRLPRGLQSLESRLRSHVQESVRRGKVNLNLGWKGEAEGGEMVWNADLAEQYVGVLQEIRARFDFRDPVTLGHLLGHPEMLTWKEPDLDAEASWDAVRKVVDGALADLVAMREREGEALSRDLLGRLDTLRENLATVEKRAPERVREAKERLHTRVTELLEGEAKADPDRILIEAALQADRMDCTEECVRLASHFDQFRDLLTDGDAPGRKLNFLLQEMNREANTIGSKGNDLSVAREVIAIKEEIEILREQVQNIE
jgi:uncharacterized protein (TIGR00255 family)